MSFCRFEAECSNAGTWRCQFCRISGTFPCGSTFEGYRQYRNKLSDLTREDRYIHLKTLFEGRILEDVKKAGENCRRSKHNEGKGCFHR